MTVQTNPPVGPPEPPSPTLVQFERNVVVLRGPVGRGQDRAAKTGVAVHVSGVERRAQQRYGGPGGHRHVLRADERRDGEGVRGRLGQPDVAGHGREADQVNLG